MNEIPTELWAAPKGLLPAIRKFLGQCPHDQVARLCAGMDAMRLVEDEKPTETEKKKAT